jgi:Concanavalin A-like lectin/glucanases superfamily/Bacterial Ig domain/PKD domain/Glucose / Sorbosone dehydrogenase
MLGRCGLGTVLAILLAGTFATAPSAATTLPAGFQETTVFSGLTNPTGIRFASDGRIFVAEKSGRIKVFDSLTDGTPDLFADLSTNVYNFWDRGLLGLALDPQFPTRPYVYVLYTYDAAIGGVAPRWGTPGVLSDPCPTPPGATADGCVVSGRVSRLTASGNAMVAGSENVLVEDWCQQYPSHSIGSLNFGADGALYVSGGDGASFNFADYGQDGNPLNPCGDPPGGVGATLTPPTAEGGALRSQDLRTSTDPTSLDGAILRIDPNTGAGLPDNPLAFSSDPNARRIVAEGLRNPFRFTIRPGTSEVWLGDVGWNDWEELNRIPAPTAGVTNFGWPCYEGNGRQPGYDSPNLTLCEDLYAQGGAVTAPYFTYNHAARVVAGEACPTGGSSVAGVAFYTGGTYPASYSGALFFEDYTRNCIWAMLPGSNGLPDPANIQTFASGAAGPVDLEVGPGGDLFYADLNGGTIRRIRYLTSNRPPTAVIAANPTSGTAPLTVQFNGSGSSDPDGDTLTYAWDLDGDGAFDDSTAVAPSRTYAAGTYAVQLRVTDPGGATGTASVTINAGNTPPVATIGSPSSTLRWKVGDTITFSGSATDAQDGTLPASALTWSLVLQHCFTPQNCHSHTLQDFVGVASGSFTAPDHEYPSYLELTLTAQDSNGGRDVKTVRLDPQTVDLTFQTSPTGLSLTVGSSSGVAPFTRTVIVGSTNSVSATSPQTLGGTTYQFVSWSDGGAQTHAIVAPAAPATYTAQYTVGPSGPAPVAAYSFDAGSGTALADASGNGNNGSISGATWSASGKYGGALAFDGANDLVSVADANSLDLTTGMTLEAWLFPDALGTTWRTAVLKEQSGQLIYALYANTDTARPSGHVFVGGDVDTRGTTTLPLNAWSHLAATYDGSTLRVFVNGVQASSRAVGGPILTSTGALRIGGNNIWGEWFSGRIDDVRIYAQPLTQTQIQNDMNTPIGGAPPQDTTPPSAPSALSATGGISSVALSWTASTDNVGVARYDVHRGTTAGFLPSAANRIAQPTGTAFTDSGLAPGTYFYKVVAADAAGNLSPPSNEASAAVTGDVQAPTASITSPAGGATVSGSVAVNANASDNVGVAGVQFKVDGQNLGAEDTSAPYSVSWNTLAAANGGHDLTAVARDAAGNTTTSAIVHVTVANAAALVPVAAYSFNAGSGTTLADVTGNGNTGTITGAAWSTAGKNGGALSFDGTSDWVTIADAVALDLTTGMTLEAWVNPQRLQSNWRLVAVKEGTGVLAYALYANSDTKRPRGAVRAGGAESDVRGPAALGQNVWTHVAVTYDGTTLRLFVNGAEVTTTAVTGAIATTTGPFRIGGSSIRSEFYKGLIDDLRLYDRALTAAEIQNDMNTPVT